MNIDFLKKRPIPQEKPTFEILIPSKKQVEIIDKRGKVNIDRNAIKEQLQKNKIVKQETEIIKEPEFVSEKVEPKKVEPEKDEPKKVESDLKIKRPIINKVLPDVDDDEIVEITDLDKRLPQEKDKIIIQASSYYMNNRKIFIRKMNELFKDYLKEIKTKKSNISCERGDEGEFDLLTHQKIVRDYINLYSPYRGILLFHGLGSGKTCSSIALAEGMKSDKRIFIMTPASLKMNFFSELKKCGDLMYKKNQYWEFVSTKLNPEYVPILSQALSLSKEYIRRKKGAWLVNVSKKPNFSDKSSQEQKAIDEQINEMIRTKYTDLNYNGMNDKQMEKITGKYTRNPFDNSVVVVDEAHNFVSRIVNKIKKKSSISYKLYEYLMSAQNVKIVLLSGTPVINYPNEIGVLFNILRGYITTWTLPIEVKTTQKIDQERILEIFDKEGFHTYDYVEYSGNQLQITRNPFGFVNVKKPGVLKGTKRTMKGGDSPIEKAEPIQEVSQEPPIEEAQQEPPIQEDSQESPVEEAQQEPPNEEAQQESPVEEEQSSEETPLEEEQPDEELEQPDDEDVEQEEELEQPQEETVTEEKEEQPEEEPQNMDDLKSELNELKEQIKQLQENNVLALERKETQDQQEKELKEELENLKQDQKDEDKQSEEEEKQQQEEDDENTFYNVFERNANIAREYIRKNVGFGGSRKNGKKSNKRKTRKLKFAEKLVPEDEEIDEELRELIELFYRQGYNQDFHTHSGGNGYFDKYNGMKLDESGNISNEEFIETVIKLLRKHKLDVKEKQINVENYTALPDKPDAFLEMFVNTSKGELMNANLFKRRILGLTSYFRSAQEELMPNVIKTDDNSEFFLMKATMSGHQFAHYESVRKKEADQDKKKSTRERINKGLDKEDMKISSTYRIFSRAACNFVFPSEIERPMPGNKDEVNEDEIDGVKKKEIKGRDDFNVEDENNIVEDVDYQKLITKSLKELAKKDKQGKSIYLNRDSLEVLSPKFVMLLDNLKHPDNVGLQLIYSQFRTIEGIGILKLILEANGYAEFKIKKSVKDGWIVSQKIGDENKPKFVLYTGTESDEEKEIIRNVYNSNWEVVPPAIVEHVNKIHKNNFMGEIIKVFMITSSGAEGINLKNTRYVHIVEPYWHMVRIKQVIGRARRICSHEDLPKALRNVKIYVYLTTLSDEQKTSDRHKELQIRDLSKVDQKTPITTDETLFEIAQLKERINSQLLDAVKSTAFDCNLYADRKNDETVVCYNLGKIQSNEFNTIPNIDIDKNETAGLNDKFIEWTAKKLTYKNKKYALNEETGEVYDLETYENAIQGLTDLVDKKVADLIYTNGKPKIEFI